MKNRTLTEKFLRGDIGFSALTAAFGFIYEQFSHGVYAMSMFYAFTVPLLLGVLPMLYLTQRQTEPREEKLLLWHCGIATWTVGLLFYGALEIYGTANRLTPVYLVAGLLLVLCAFIPRKHPKPAEENVQ